MNDFFHGWRRKLGVVTLVVACVFTAIWIRTHRHGDEIIVTVLGRAHSIGWERERVSWWTWRLRPPSRLAVHWDSWTRFSNADWPYRRSISVERDSDFEEELWRRRQKRNPNPIEGFDFHRVYEREPIFIGHIAAEHALAVWEVRCWSIVIPLTALSAWLLLSKPMQKPKLPPVQNHA